MQLPKVGDLLLEKYKLESLLGTGGMGVVFAAQHKLLGKRVAVKLLMPEIVKNPDAATRFMNEARAAARIENDHVAQVLDVGQLDDGLPYMVLEYLDGNDLAHRLAEHGPLPVDEVADHLMQAIEAVAHAHALGIIHRDLKPANLFLARRPDGTVRVKVLDFGISKALGASPGESVSVTKTSAILGSPLYMSPEQLRDSKNVDHRCDVWAFGVIAYELLTGKPPFNGENAVALFAAIHEAEPVSLRVTRPEIGVQLDLVIMKCLRRRPEERYSSVTELASCLVPFGTEDSVQAFERTKRILPLVGPGSRRPQSERPPSSMTPTPSSASAELGVEATWNTESGDPPKLDSKPISKPASSRPAKTADPWATSQSEEPDDESWKARRRKAQIGVGVALAALALITGGAVVLPRVLGGNAPPAQPAAPGTSATSTKIEALVPPPEPAASASSSGKAKASAAPSVSPAASASAKADAGAAAAPSASASAAASAAATASASAAPASASASASPAGTATATAEPSATAAPTATAPAAPTTAPTATAEPAPTDPQ